MSYMKQEAGTNIHIALDDYIPFCKYFIIPYMLWFAYIAATVIFFFFYNRNEFIKYALFLITGMSICVVIYYIWPSYQTLRPTLTDSDIFTSIIGFIYSADSSSNICPSIHVLNSLAAHIATYWFFLEQLFDIFLYNLINSNTLILLYISIYSMKARITAYIPSRTECCFKNTVERQISTMSTNEPAF